MDKKIEIIQLNQINKDMDEDDNISVKYVSFDQNERSMYENIPESSEYGVVNTCKVWGLCCSRLD